MGVALTRRGGMTKDRARITLFLPDALVQSCVLAFRFISERVSVRVVQKFVYIILCMPVCIYVLYENH